MHDRNGNQPQAGRPASGSNRLSIDSSQDGRRLDNLLVSLLGNPPRSLVYKLIRTGQVRVNGRRAKPAQRLCAGDEVRLPPQARPGAPQRRLPKQRPQLEVVYEDDDVLVLDKPSGIAVHAGSGLSWGLIDLVRDDPRWRDQPVELVHRLDRGTSGCLLLAKNRRSLARLHDAWRNGEVKKRYRLLAVGASPKSHLHADAALIRTRVGGEKTMAQVEAAPDDAQEATTDFVRVESFPAGYTLLDAIPATGRTHQIRVHAAGLGLPLAGDDRYGDRDANARLREFSLTRLFLHALELEIPGGSVGGSLKVQAPLPRQLEQVLQRLRR